jgi:predicted SAM-dependent methyltransferase
VDPLIAEWAAEFNGLHGPFGRVLELGSRDYTGAVRPAFANCGEYVGLDASEGAGVDLLFDAHALWQAHELGSFHCIVATSFFEHDARFWETLAGLRARLKPGGWFVVTVPSLDFPLHGYPNDYYRFTEQAVREVLMDGYQDVEIFNPLWQHPEESPHLRCQHLGAWGHT